MILFAAPNLIPTPPGSSTILGLPLLLIASQLLVGRPRLWLPRALSERSLDTPTFAGVARRMEPVLRRFERLVRPRWWPVSQRVAGRVVGFVVLVMAGVLVLPIPLGNWPPAAAIVLVSFALMERDGLWLACGVLAAIGSLVLVGGVIGSVWLAVQAVF